MNCAMMTIVVMGIINRVDEKVKERTESVNMLTDEALASVSRARAIFRTIASVRE